MRRVMASRRTDMDSAAAAAKAQQEGRARAQARAAAAAAAAAAAPSVAPASPSARALRRLNRRHPFTLGSSDPCGRCGVVGHRTATCIAHLHPHVILHVLPAKKHRFATQLLAVAKEAEQQRTKQGGADEAKEAGEERMPSEGLEVVENAKEPELLFLRTPRPLSLMRWIQHSPLFNRHYNSIFLATAAASEAGADGIAGDALGCGWVFTEQELVGKVEDMAARWSANRATGSAGVSDGSMVFRVQTYPKLLRSELLGSLSSCRGVSIHPHDFTHVLFVVRAYNKLYYGVSGKESYVMPHATATGTGAGAAARAPEEDVLSRAYFKLAESFLLDERLRARVGEGSFAIDIGASPGGWSAFLASRGARVLAIDPGVVHCASPLVQHVAKRVEDSLDEVRAFAAEARQRGQGGVGLIVCDMNVRPQDSVELIRALLEIKAEPGADKAAAAGSDSAAAAASAGASPLSILSPSALLVLTCKETQLGRSKSLVEDAQSELGVDGWGQFSHYYLLSNGRERTLIGAWEGLGLSAEQKAERRKRREEEVQRKQAAWEERIKETPTPLQRSEEKKAKKAQAKLEKAQKAAAAVAAVDVTAGAEQEGPGAVDAAAAAAGVLAPA